MVLNHFAEIILPLALDGTFTYHIESNDLDKIKIGQRVAVPFGARKIYTGIVHSIHNNKPELYKTKGIYAFLDDAPLVLPFQIKFWEWLANYYMCSLGEVYRNAFPSALKLESETFVRLIQADIELSQEWSNEMSTVEFLVFNELKNRQILSVLEVAQITEEKSALSILKSLMDKNLVRLDEKLQDKYTPKIENYLKIHPTLKSDDDKFFEIIGSLGKAPKQREVILQLIADETQSPKPIKVSEFIKKMNSSNAVINALADKEIIEIYRLQTIRIDENEKANKALDQLTEAQNVAYEFIKKQFNDKNTVLLHGVTASGKTQIYQKMIEDTIASGKKVLFLVPEIGITTQLVQRIKNHFGNLVGVYHSKFSQNERVELWQQTLENKYSILIGPRSAIFLPIENIGLIVIDEEHDSSYKQADVKPFFQARDVSQILANYHNAKVLLGSATPSAESYNNAINAKYGYVELKERFGNLKMPKMELVDLKEAIRRKKITEDISHSLKEAIEENLKEKKQVIIFQNRRGYAPIMECENCGYTPICPNCDVSLTYHKYPNLLRCHYCGYSQSKPAQCPSCHSYSLMTKGIGTEQIEQQLEKLFPEARIKRMDVDAMRGKHAYEKLIEAFESREVDIVVGTQMITKGLDFSHVNLVGVIRADSLLNFPDFRAHERAFQMLYQVAGRAGRREEQGRVLVQTYNPYHQILQNVSLYEYKKTIKEILYERKNFHYPPFVRLIHVKFRHAKKERVDKTAQQFVDLLKSQLQDKFLLGPEAPAISRINNLYIMDVLIKIGPENNLIGLKKYILQILHNMKQIPAYKSVRIDIDVDPN